MKLTTNTNKEIISPEKTNKLGGAKGVKFNPLLPEFCANPYPVYHHLRSEDPVHQTKSFMSNEWLLTRYDDVKLVLNDPRFYVDDLPERLKHKSFYLRQQGDFNVLTQTISKWLFFLNPPDHTQLRGLVSKAFAPGEVECMRPYIQEIVDELIGKVQDAGVMDIISNLASPLPAIVTAKILGVPTEERTKLTQWAYELFRVFDQPMSLEGYEHLNRVALEFREYFHDLVVEREKKPKEDLISNLIAARDQGGKLSEEELLAFCAMLFSVGQETTENFIGNAMLALLHHPDQMEKLKREPTIIQTAVGELLRYDSPVQLIARVSIADVSIGDKMIRAGERVHLSLGAANRDPAQFPNPDQLDITRRDNRNLPFGSGIHYCLGAALARVQGQIAINTLVQRLPNLKIHTDTIEWRKNIVLRGVKALPVTFTPSKSLSYQQ